MSNSNPNLRTLVRELIAAEVVKSEALYAHASSPTDDSLDVLVRAALVYSVARSAVEAALNEMEEAE